MRKSERLLKELDCKGGTDHDLLVTLNCLVRHIIDNDLKHIWLVLQILLGAVIVASVGLIITHFKW